MIQPEINSKSYFKRAVQNPSKIYFKRNELKIYDEESSKNCKFFRNIEEIEYDVESFPDSYFEDEEQMNVIEDEEIIEKAEKMKKGKKNFEKKFRSENFRYKEK